MHRSPRSPDMAERCCFNMMSQFEEILSVVGLAELYINQGDRDAQE
jgi:hypothetical protein